MRSIFFKKIEKLAVGIEVGSFPKITRGLEALGQFFLLFTTIEIPVLKGSSNTDYSVEIHQMSDSTDLLHQSTAIVSVFYDIMHLIG